MERKQLWVGWKLRLYVMTKYILEKKMLKMHFVYTGILLNPDTLASARNLKYIFFLFDKTVILFIEHQD